MRLRFRFEDEGREDSSAVRSWELVSSRSLSSVSDEPSEISVLSSLACEPEDVSDSSSDVRLKAFEV